ncbi:MAG: hypothetical protein V8T46_11230 [Sutterella seckii]
MAYVSDELGSAKASDVKNLPALIYMLVNAQGNRLDKRCTAQALAQSGAEFFLSRELTLEEMAAENIPVDGGVGKTCNIPAVPIT